MLSRLRIENFALIDQLEIEFDARLNVLTGETGAGKSIILDAIDVVLGGKVNNRLIRQGAQQASLEATFQVNGHLLQWLKAQQIEPLEDDCLVCSRELAFNASNLRSRSRINGTLVNRQLMGQLRELLVEITAQGQTIQLVDAENQRELLDLYGGEGLLQQRARVSKTYEITREAAKILAKRRQSEQERLQRLDLIQFQIKELAESGLGEAEELEQLEQERDRLSHVVELQQLSYQTYQLLYQNDHGERAVADLLAEAESILTHMTEYDKDISSILEIVQSALTQIVEAGQQINSYGESLEVDPERLESVESRIMELKRICRKYGPSLAEVIAHYDKLQQELAELTNQEQSLEKLEQDYQIAQANLLKECAALTELRQQAADKLEKELVKNLKPLGMEKVIFVCQLSPSAPKISGSDTVVFYFSPNPGEKIQPLASTASGGEMSRFLLALKACFRQTNNPQKTLIFDEIDAGVSGKVAQAIAEKLHNLSQTHQLLCVTHQPLVAAMADAHYRVEKEIIEETFEITESLNGLLNFPEIRTVVRVKRLDNHQTRREELAQLTGGHSAQEAITFADSLLSKAAAYRATKLD